MSASAELFGVSVGSSSYTYDYDGNKYKTIIIGTQEWFVENLKTETYADGTPIPNLTLNANWIAEDGTGGHDGAYCYYDNDIAYKADYGALYNWYAVDNVHGLAPTGWRVPSETDWGTLNTFLGGTAIAGGKLKEIGLTHWTTPNTGATDEYGVSVISTGERWYADGTFRYIGLVGNTWSRTEYNPTVSKYSAIAYDDIYNNIGSSNKAYGYSVRCMRDI